MDEIKTNRYNTIQDSYCRTYNNFYGMISGTRMDIQKSESGDLTFYKIHGDLVEDKDRWQEFLNASFWGSYELKKSVYGQTFYTLNDYLTFIQNNLSSCFNNKGHWSYDSYNSGNKTYKFTIYNNRYRNSSRLDSFEYEFEIISLSNKNVKFGSPFSRVTNWDCIYDCIQNQKNIYFIIDNLNRSSCVLGSHWQYSSMMEDEIEFSNEHGDVIKTKVLNAQDFWKRINELEKLSFPEDPVSESILESDSPSVSEYLGTLQGAVEDIWKLHLQTNKYKIHKELQNLYDELFNLVDTLIESYQGKYGIVKGLKSVLKLKEDDSVVDSIKKLKEFTDDNRLVLVKTDSDDDDDSELLSLVDDILNLFNKTIFLLR